MGQQSDSQDESAVATAAEIEALMPPDIPEDEMTVAVCGEEV